VAQEDAPGPLAMVPDSRDVPAESTLLSLRLPDLRGSAYRCRHRIGDAPTGAEAAGQAAGI